MKKYLIYLLVFILGGILFLGGSFIFLKYKMNEKSEEAEEEAKKDLKNEKTSFLSKPTFLFSDTIANKDLEYIIKDIKSDKSYKFSDKKGKLLVINNWATWCIPCVAELPYFKKLMDETKGENIEFLFLSNEETEKLTDFEKDKKLDLPIYHSSLDDVDSTSMFFTNSIPMTIILSPNQNYYLKSNGSASWYSKELKEFLLKQSKI